ncbi:uncharacterized protein TrAtP1_002162 [Trichoderma atroviride]|uniref:Zn(2)-C6 fungal-type domain-containing protein n=1 Tax=Hypocrea atroviridis (strain ATCC 20476 / IMI 206040) TaxID=452589 RepID=G9P2S4_HYPAI|nr:uncharacterized protein TRIATDRAFT_34342 [Trichoderma atroviride IMI 206040]EHK42752.1 hypothetical protein TRIATDRAFT_34342 [Trichoderma atroviride IMI 206040]UKZ60893.1 hypothetical protein TrAtP1_002162 [Trichoderma atroviride]
MEPDPISELPRPKGRQRAKKACTECRRRKRKCDGHSPCLMCSQYDYVCRYEEEAGLVHSLPKRPFEADSRRGDASNAFRVSSPSPEDSSRQDPKTPTTPVSPLNRGVIEPAKRRYMSQSSAVAFPNQLGVELKSPHPPRLHSFGWNCGIRSEEQGSVHTPLTEFVSWDECRRYAEVYFANVDAPFHLFDKAKFLQQCEVYYSGPNQHLVLGAVIGGVVALGSLFSFRQGHALESEIVKHVKDVLEDSVFSRLPSVDQVNAWILRTLYLRATTRPHLTWLASCNVMHLVEAVGLHRDIDSDLVTQTVEAPAVEDEGHKRTFWIAWSVNTLIAYEYGRSKIHFDGVESRLVPFADDSDAGLQVRMARALPNEGSGGDVVSVSRSLENAIFKLSELGDIKGFPALTRGDICFCLYRRLRLLKISVSRDTVSHILTIGHTAVEAASEFAQREIPWWNVLGTTFQFFCVLLAIDNYESLAQVSWVHAKLREVYHRFETRMGLEALEAAATLRKALLTKKQQEINLLTPEDQVFAPFPEREFTPDWDVVLNPYYTTGAFNFTDFGGV